MGSLVGAHSEGANRYALFPLNSPTQLDFSFLPVHTREPPRAEGRPSPSAVALPLYNTDGKCYSIPNFREASLKTDIRTRYTVCKKMNDAGHILLYDMIKYNTSCFIFQSTSVPGLIRIWYLLDWRSALPGSPSHNQQGMRVASK